MKHAFLLVTDKSGQRDAYGIGGMHEYQCHMHNSN